MSENSIALPTLKENGSCESSLSARLASLKRVLLGLSEKEAKEYFQLTSEQIPLKTTISLCADCLSHVIAIVYTDQKRVLIRKDCLVHGFSDALLEADQEFYYLSNKDSCGQRFATDRVLEIPSFEGSCCGGGSCGGESGGPSDFFTDQMPNKTCTILVEVTDACNLTCQVCYADARGDRKMPLETFKGYIRQLIDKKGTLDSVQLTGGEAALHPEFWEMIAFLYQQPEVRKIYLPTNGIFFTEEKVAQKLKPFADKVMVLLQFDSQKSEANRKMRNADPAGVREKVIAQLGKYQIPMQLTMTIAEEINDDEIGWVVDIGAKHPHVRVVALQPVTYSGRYDSALNPMRRLTLSDIAKAVVAQAHLKMKERDFVPIPCSHPNCGWLTLFVRRWGLKKNILKYIDLGKSMATVANKSLLTTEELRKTKGGSQKGLLQEILSLIGRRLIRSTDIFTIAIKPFMDRFSYDQDRIASCCHHTMDTSGNAVSFCEYNALLRPNDSWDKFPSIQTKS